MHVVDIVPFCMICTMQEPGWGTSIGPGPSVGSWATPHYITLKCMTWQQQRR